MGLQPRGAVAIDIHQIPRRQLTLVGGGENSRAAYRRYLSARKRGDAGQALEELAGVCIRASVEPWQQCEQGCETLAEQRDICSGEEIRLRRIGDVGACRNHPGAAAVCGSDHLAGSPAHLAEAHLAEEVEVVLVEQYELGFHGAQLAVVVLDAFGQHGIEQRHLVPRAPQYRGYLQCRERRIRFGALVLLLIETQKIGVANQDRQHFARRSGTRSNGSLIRPRAWAACSRRATYPQARGPRAWLSPSG